MTSEGILNTVDPIGCMKRLTALDYSKRHKTSNRN